MEGLWGKRGVPRKDWYCIYVEDLYGPLGTCAMCGNEDIRFVHIMRNEKYEHDLEVDWSCAEKMSKNYVNPSPREQEEKLENKFVEKSDWLERNWHVSENGNSYIDIKGFRILVFLHQKGDREGKWGFHIREFSIQGYQTRDEAKLAAFEKIWMYKEDWSLSPREHGIKLRNKEAEKRRWLEQEWYLSGKGNDYLNINDCNVTIFQYKKLSKSGMWGFNIQEFSSATYQTSDEAKLAAFEERWEHLISNDFTTL